MIIITGSFLTTWELSSWIKLMIQRLAMLLFFTCSAAVYADTDRLLGFYNELLGYGARNEGSAEEQMAFDAVAGRLDALDIHYKRHRLDTQRRGHSYSEIIEATIPGASDERYILASPMEQGAFSTALLLEVAENLIISSPRHSITLFFLGGERGNTAFHPYGSRYAIDAVQPDSEAFAIYIAAETMPKTWEIKIGGNGVVAPYWFTKALMNSVVSGSIPHRFEGADIHVANLGLQGDMGSFSRWLEEGLPAIAFQGRGSGGKDDAAISISRFVRVLLDIDRLVTRNDRSQESIYIYAHPFERMKPLFIRELPFVIIFLGIISILAVSILLQYRSVYLNFKRVSKHWWNWPLLFFLVFLYFVLGTLLVEEILRLKDFPSLWIYSPGTFLFFKFIFIGAFSMNFILFSHGIPLPRTPHFYSYAAVMTSYLLTLVIIPLDITLASYSLWASCALSLFTIIRNFKFKIFFLFLAAIPYILILAVVLTRPYMPIVDFLLMDRITGNLFNTLALLPIILALACLNFWHSHYEEISHNAVFYALTLIMNATAVITLAWLPRLSPFDENHPQPIEIRDKIDLVNHERWLEFDSPGPIGDTELIIDGSLYSFENLSRQSRVRTLMNQSPLEVSSENQEFLDNRTINIAIAGKGRPQHISLRIHADSPFTLHSASQPFEMASSGQEADIFVGDNPPFPFNFQLTVSNETPVFLSVTAAWRNPEDAPIMKRRNIRPSVSRIVYAEYAL
ncbi:MAG: hypothetical protein B6D68_02980 [spirochete symbiont of Stewartia floridana]|nr:MAG: hypothetical protein B6D68_02980 [spirochete symbiont of Stewartia floridana]